MTIRTILRVLLLRQKVLVVTVDGTACGSIYRLMS